MASVAVVGLGYVGLPLVAAFASVGVKVVGLDKNEEKIQSLRDNGIADFYEVGVQETIARWRPNIKFTASYSEAMEECDTIFITVGTDMLEDGTLDLGGVNNCQQLISQNLRQGQLVVLKSTVPCGTTRQFAESLEKSTGLLAGTEFFVSYWPERTIEGHALHELHFLPKIVGSLNESSAELAVTVIGKLGGKIVTVSSPEVAEMCKLVDNTYRSVNIAFANEVGQICEALSVDANELVTAINDGYDRTSLFRSGLGAGGPCLSKDPSVLLKSALDRGISAPIIGAGILGNIEATERVADYVVKHLKQTGNSNPKIVLVGLAFKGTPQTDDIRGAPSVVFNTRLSEEFPEATLVYCDPLISIFNGVNVTKDLSEAIRSADVVMFLTDHSSLKDIPTSLVVNALPNPNLLIVDCWHNLANPSSLSELGAKVIRIGDGTI